MLEASAMAGYQSSALAISQLLTDDAPQFKRIAPNRALCWVHEGRHDKKLSPFVPRHRHLLQPFLDRFWAFYHQLLAYKHHPMPLEAQRLQHHFDELFTTTTGYTPLDECIQRTHAKKQGLLQVLHHPSLPCHNHAAELGARFQARYRDISFHTMSEEGTYAKDTLMTIIATARKLSVSTYHYLYDRVSEGYLMPALAALIQAKKVAIDTG